MKRDYKAQPLTRDEALVLLGKAIKEKEDFVHPKHCVYALTSHMESVFADHDIIRDENGRFIPSCIVGYILDEMGLLEEAAEWNNTGVFMNLGPVLDAFTQEAIHLLDNVQKKQDAKFSWEEAVFSCPY